MTKRTIIGAALGVAVAFGFFTVQPEAETFGKLDKKVFEEIQENESVTMDILVKMSEQADLSATQLMETKEEKGAYVYEKLTEVAQRTQPALLEALAERNVTTRRFYIVNMVLVEGASKDLINELATRDDVSKIYADQIIEMRPPTFNLVSLHNESGIESSIEYIGADRVWSEFGVKGAGIVVAGQDTGIDWDHPAIVEQYRGKTKDAVNHNYNWYDAIRKPITGGSSCGYANAEPCDDNAHGTHTIGTVIGDDGQGNQIGVAPESQWIGCRNMDAGNGRPQTYMACFEFFLAPHAEGANPMTDGRPEMAPHVMNNSWGCPSSEKCRGDVLLDILQTMKAAGVFVVVSAGNSGSRCKTIKDTPAWHSADTFSVGAFDHRKETIAGFSSRGPSSFDGQIGPDIVAPGVSIRSSVPGGGFQGGFWSGTSMAGPHVAGVVALVWAAQPALIGKIDETAQLIIDTARPIPSNGCMGMDADGNVASTGEAVVPNNYYGHGMIDAYEAVKAALAL